MNNLTNTLLIINLSIILVLKLLYGIYFPLNIRHLMEKVCVNAPLLEPMHFGSMTPITIFFNQQRR